MTFRHEFENSRHWSDDVWKSRMAGGRGNKKIFQYCTDPSGQLSSLSLSSSRSFRTQSHSSFITGQRVDSEQFLRVHLSHRMCNQFTLHHKLKIDCGRTNFQQRQTDGIFHSPESHEEGSQGSARA